VSELAIFGGSFDPPHVGHVLLVSYALSVSSIERVIVAPVYSHALGKELTAFEHRLRMCELAFAPLRSVEVSDIEQHLGGTSYTIELLEAIRDAHPGQTLRLLIGADILRQAYLWRDFARVRALAPLLVAGRGGFSHPEVDPEAPVLPAVSSSEVRRALSEGRDVHARVPLRVLRYIETHRLYQPEPT
jgi:nicotinate-nucleotide adenylyltransferase